nr:hypothetical protein CFP56_65891 [Quercus suber]
MEPSIQLLPAPVMTLSSVESVEQTPTTEGLFAGLSFFLVQRIPARSNIVALIQSNGGRVVKLESKATYILADHQRNDAPPGSISWTYVDQALRDRSIPDASNYVAGPAISEPRPVGSVLPKKTTRTPFTAAEDRGLYVWVEIAAAKGALVKGNEVYKQYAALHPQHTYQSWRDRYMKRLQDNPPDGVYPGGFTQAEHESLLSHAEDIEDIVEDQKGEAWSAYAAVTPGHTAVQWANFYDDHVRPVYLDNQKRASALQRSRKRKRDSEDRAEEIDGPSSERTGSGSRGSKARPEEESATRNSDEHITVDVISGSARNAPEDHVKALPGPSSQKRLHDHDGGILNIDTSAASTVAIESAQDNNVSGALLDATTTFPTGKGTDAEERFRREIMGSNHMPEKYPPCKVQTSMFIEPRLLNSVTSTTLVDPVADEQIFRDPFGNHENHGRYGNGEELLTSRPHLTTANLQSHGHEHESAVVRGVDLPEDEESHDQEQFVSYLSSFVTQNDPFRGSVEQGESDSAPNDAGHLPQAESIRQTQHPRHIESATAGKNIQLDTLPESDTGLVDEGGLPLTSDIGVDLGDYTNSQALQYSDSDVLEAFVRSALLESSQPESDATGENASSRPKTLKLFETQMKVAARDVGMKQDEPGSDGVDVDLSVVEPEGGFEMTSPLKPTTSPSLLTDTHRTVPETASEMGHQKSIYHRYATQEIVEASSPLRVGDDTATQQGKGDDTESRHRKMKESVQEARNHTKSRALETQDILNLETQVPDLEIPSPIDSDDDFSSGSSVNMLSSRPATELSHPSPTSLHRRSFDGWESELISGRPGTGKDTGHHSGFTGETMLVPPPAPTPPQRHETPPTQSQDLRKLANAVRLVEGDDVDEYITTLNVRHGFQVDAVIDALKCTSMRPELTEIVLFDRRSGRGFPRDVPGIWSADEDVEIESGVASRLREAEDKHGWDEVIARLEFLREWRE